MCSGFLQKGMDIYNKYAIDHFQSMHLHAIASLQPAKQTERDLQSSALALTQAYPTGFASLHRAWLGVPAHLATKY